MEWSDTYLTGIASIDKQHQGLFKCFATLENAAAEERLLATTYALGQLTKYVASHFVEEEKLMEKHSYPHLTEHKVQHDAFSAKLIELKVLASKRDISDATVQFLREWLIRHIMVADMSYVSYINDD